MSAGDAPGATVEQRALRASLWVGISFAVVSAVGAPRELRGDPARRHFHSALRVHDLGLADCVPHRGQGTVLKAFAEVNPFTIVVNALRHLWLGAPAGNNVWGAVVWSFVILAIFSPLAVARYRRAASK